MQLTRILSLILMMGAAALRGTAAAPEHRPVSLDDCVQLALQHNLGLQIQRIDPLLKQYAISLAYATYEPSFSFSGRQSYSSSPGGIYGPFNIPLSSTTDVDSFQFGVSGRLPSGGTLTLDTEANKTTRSGFSAGQSASASAGVTLTQPLLKNFWIDFPRLTVALRKKDLKVSELALQQKIIQTVTDVQVAYLSLIAAIESVEVRKMDLQQNEQLLRETKKRIDVGVLANLDEKSAEAAVASARAALIQAQSDLARAQNNLKTLLTDKYSEWQDLNLEPTEKLTAPVQVFSRQDSWQKGLTMRPDLLQARIGLEQRNLTLRYNKNQLFPELDLNATYRQTGSGIGVSQFSGAYAGVQRGDSPSYSYALSLTIPLGNRQARYTYKSAKAEIEAALLSLKQLEQGIMLEIDNLIAQAQSSLERVDSTEKAVQFADAAWEAERKRLDNGKSTSYEVLLRQRDRSQARFNKISALIDYNTALARLAQSEGSTLERAGIRIEAK
jgi:outer membrane protein TolC